jgi:SAM-dependent methyltransferase
MADAPHGTDRGRPGDPSGVVGSSQINERLWLRAASLHGYGGRVLRPVEVDLMLRHRCALSGRVLDAGCGAGRLLGYLLALGGDVHGIDISARMIDHCRREYPRAAVQVGDLRALAETVDGPFDCVIAADNVLDVFDDGDRVQVLSEISHVLVPGGLLIFSSHNLARAGADRRRRPSDRLRALLTKVSQKPLSEIALAARSAPRRWSNRRRLRPLELHADGYAVLNDSEADYGVLHYYVDRDEQERQLAAVGYELVECLDVDGSVVGAGERGRAPWLHYVARPASAGTLETARRP